LSIRNAGAESAMSGRSQLRIGCGLESLSGILALA
jgi:hypothetical protein